MCIGPSLLPRLEHAWGTVSFFLAEGFRGPVPWEGLWASGSVPCPARGSLQTGGSTSPASHSLSSWAGLRGHESPLGTSHHASANDGRHRYA